MRRSIRSIVLAGLGAEAAYLALALRPRPGPAAVLWAAGAAFLFYAFAGARCGLRVREGKGIPVGIVLGFAALFRLTLLFLPPILSDDLYRYLWDGKVQAAGRNPYLLPPSAPDLDGLDDPLRASVNHPDVPTIYPPLAQIVFLAVASVVPAVPAMKAIFLLFELATIGILWRMVKRLGRSPTALVWYAWNPLAVIEVAGNGHNDPLGICLLLLAVLLILQDRSGLSMAALAGSIGAKWVAAALLPLFFVRGPRAGRPARIVAQAAIGAGALGLLWLPYRAAGRALWTGLGIYADRWRSNDFGFALIHSAFARLDMADPLKRFLAEAWPGSGDSPLLQFLYRHVHPPDLAKASVAIILIGVLAVLIRRGGETPRQVFLFLGWALLLAPTLHPWYLLWILPFAALYASPGWIGFSGLVLLSYLPVNLPAEGITPLRLAEYLPLLALLAWGYFRRPAPPSRTDPRPVPLPVPGAPC